jgi:hypothetical protein
VNRLVVARTVLAGVELLAPTHVLRAIAGDGINGSASRVVRVLGTRDLVQAAVTYVRPSRAVLVGGAVVDSLHAISMVALAVASPRNRRAGGTSAVVAALMAADQVRFARRR